MRVVLRVHACVKVCLQATARYTNRFYCTRGGALLYCISTQMQAILRGGARPFLYPILGAQHDMRHERHDEVHLGANLRCDLVHEREYLDVLAKLLDAREDSRDVLVGGNPGNSELRQRGADLVRDDLALLGLGGLVRDIGIPVVRKDVELGRHHVLVTHRL